MKMIYQINNCQVSNGPESHGLLIKLIWPLKGHEEKKKKNTKIVKTDRDIDISISVQINQESSKIMSSVYKIVSEKLCLVKN